MIMTKQEEIDHWRKFVEALPTGSYLYSMFAGSGDMVENMIRNDFAFPTVPALRRQSIELSEDNRELEKKNKKLAEGNVQLESQCQFLSREIVRHRKEIEGIAKIAQRIYAATCEERK